MTKKIKILHLSHNKEFGGYGAAARQDIFALDEGGFDLVTRSVDFKPEVTNKALQKLDSKSLDGITHAIQYLVPHCFERFPGVKNIGYFETESDNLSYSTWPDCMNMVDEIWVPNKQGAESVKKICNLPVRVVPHAVNNSFYKREYPLTKIVQTQGNYHFYSIGEHIPRKNLETLIAAYFVEFDPTEPVSLIIKTNRGMDEDIRAIQAKVNLYSKDTAYQQIVVIDQRLTEQQIYGLHQSADCYVNVSSGESWCLPLIDAIGFGKGVITNNEGGPKDIVETLEGALKVGNSTTWCIGHTIFPGFQNGLDTWRAVDFMELRAAMRFAYENNIKTDPAHLENEYGFDKFCDNVRVKL